MQDLHSWCTSWCWLHHGISHASVSDTVDAHLSVSVWQCEDPSLRKIMYQYQAKTINVHIIKAVSVFCVARQCTKWRWRLQMEQIPAAFRSLWQPPYGKMPSVEAGVDCRAAAFTHSWLSGVVAPQSEKKQRGTQLAHDWRRQNLRRASPPLGGLWCKSHPRGRSMIILLLVT